MSQYTPRIPSMSDLSHREGLMIVAAVSLLMIVLVILRFGCNVCIDVCVLRDLTAGRNTMRDFWNFVCPCCRLQRQEHDEEEQMRGESEIDLSDVNSLLLRLTTQEKSLLISSILTSKVSLTCMYVLWRNSSCLPRRYYSLTQHFLIVGPGCHRRGSCFLERQWEQNCRLQSTRG